MDVGERVGDMNREWLDEKLEDFGCAVNDECAAVDEILQRLNALATTTRTTNDDVVDGLIAYLLNLKRTLVGADVVEEFAKQEASKTAAVKTSGRHSMAGGGSETAASAYNALQRSILRELPLQSNSAVATAADEEDDNGGFEVGCGVDEDFVGMEQPFQRDEKPTSAALGVKSAYCGRLFAAAGGSQAATATRLRVFSECDPTAYGYGNANLMFDLNEIFDGDDEFDDGKLIYDKVNDENVASLTTTAAVALTLTGIASPADGGRRLTTNNVLLQTASRSVPLNLDRLERFALFPGRRLTLTGRLIDGVFHAESASDQPRLPLSSLDRTTDFDQLRVCVASGPFAASDGGGDAFANILKHSVNEHANALILIGPFVAKDSAVTTAPDDVFASYMHALLQFLRMRAPQMRVLVVPCGGHDLCAMPYFPTPPYVLPQTTAEMGDESSSGLHKNITLLPDPAVFELEGVRFAVTSSEVVLHLSRSEVYKSADAENEDRMHRLISHIFSHSLYPLCPGDASLPISLKNLRVRTELTTRPHVLIVPSILQSGVKVVDRCLAVNPGRAVRGKSAGTFAMLNIDLKSAVISLEDAIEAFSAVSLLSSVLSA